MTEFERWIERADDEEIRSELLSIRENQAEIDDRFYRELEFGTGGLRGVIGAGTNRMNVYTVARATSGLAEYVLKNGIDKKAVIAYDSRNKSKEFAKKTAEIFASKGIEAHLFERLTPTPVLSYAVRKLNAGVGVVITASHNPKEYNGYKVYNEKGCQITDQSAKLILGEIKNADYFCDTTDKKAKIVLLDDKIENDFLDDVKKFSYEDGASASSVKVVYTPLHGTGNIPVRKILSQMGVDVTVVKEQELPDGEFTTCPYPNPEEKETLEIAVGYALKTGADLVLATDPDADRVGIAIKDKKGGYKLINGNETGVILMDYILSQKSLRGELGACPTVIKTIVTTDMCFDIANAYGANVKEVLTGFKYIGEELDKTDNYVFGLEESYGYLVGDHARDKDAVSASMLIVEACAYYKKQGKTLLDQLDYLYEKYGYYKTDLSSFKYEGKEGMKIMANIIDGVRNAPISRLNGEKVEFTDFSKGVQNLPKSNVLRFKSDNARLIIRPSGTEPKLKIYYQVKGSNKQDASEKLQELKDFAVKYLGN